MAAVPRTRRHRLLQEYNVVTWLLEIYYYYYIYGYSMIIDDRQRFNILKLKYVGVVFSFIKLLPWHLVQNLQIGIKTFEWDSYKTQQ